MPTRKYLTSQAKIQYNVITLTLALKAQLISPACYSFHQTSRVLHFHINLHYVILLQNQVWNDFKEFLIKSTANFTRHLRQLVLNIDEVYVQSDFSY